jgi:hypothetical protein
VNSALLRTSGRIAASVAGLCAVYFLLRHAGFREVLDTLARGAPLFPLVLVLEAGILACSMCALRLLYGDDRHRLPLGGLVRAGLIGYAVMGLLPAGRTFAESARAALLSRYSTNARAWVAAVRLQGVSLLANAAISVLAFAALYHVTGPSVPAFLVAGNMAVTAALGGAILFAGRRSKLGALLGKLVPRVDDFGREFDSHFAEKTSFPFRPFCFEFGGRALQVVQNGVLIVAVGGAFGVLHALCGEGLHLAGAAMGDLIPAQLGATEANFELSARVLSLKSSDALSIALLAHLAQLFWVSAGLLLEVVRGAPSGLMSFPKMREN